MGRIINGNVGNLTDDRTATFVCMSPLLVEDEECFNANVVEAGQGTRTPGSMVVPMAFGDNCASSFKLATAAGAYSRFSRTRGVSDVRRFDGRGNIARRGRRGATHEGGRSKSAITSPGRAYLLCDPFSSSRGKVCCIL